MLMHRGLQGKTLHQVSEPYPRTGYHHQSCHSQAPAAVLAAAAPGAAGLVDAVLADCPHGCTDRRPVAVPADGLRAAAWCR